MQTEINTALKHLKQGRIILYPTDTVWGIGCDATNSEAIKKIFRLKQRAESKSMICLVSDIKMLDRFVEKIPKAAIDIIKNATKPTTIIYEKPMGVAENLINDDNTLAIRIVNEDFCNVLINKLQRPMVSTSANISGQPTPRSYKEISIEILKGVDYIVSLHQDKNTENPSSIIKITNDGKIEVIRK